MGMKLRTSLFGLTVAVVVGASLPVQATTVGLVGFVDFTRGHRFGIDSDTPVTGLATFDESLLTDPDGILNYLDDSTMALEFQVGRFSFDSADDDFLDLTFGFSGTDLESIALVLGEGKRRWGLDISYDFPGSTNVFSITNRRGRVRITGEVNPVTEVNPVPEPATLALLGSGLLGLVGLLRRPGRNV